MFVATSSKCVTLYGPQTELWGIAQLYNGRNSETALLGSSMKIMLYGEDLLFMKAALLEEVLKRGFKLLSSINDEVLTLSREVKL